MKSNEALQIWQFCIRLGLVVVRLRTVYFQHIFLAQKLFNWFILILFFIFHTLMDVYFRFYEFIGKIKAIFLGLFLSENRFGQISLLQHPISPNFRRKKTSKRSPWRPSTKLVVKELTLFHRVDLVWDLPFECLEDEFYRIRHKFCSMSGSWNCLKKSVGFPFSEKSEFLDFSQKIT